ncbi:hypothetical protein D9756_008410 [Leucocoprinus leucothites]|uniref:SWR1-complex protein 5 n=1 Tax=Leucocoprinus leucothites TaxID=201217 RepID=A0A8H5D2M7_9AGAR|nr:hypothetical protein D9756_008410 [Leucoagaricus leucothites]
MDSAAAKRSQSDSEDDDDYVPPTGEKLSSDSGEESRVDQQTEAESPLNAEELERKQRERDALWTTFQASVASSSKQGLKVVEKIKMVKVQKRYLFAGEYITEIVEVPEDSPDAKKWPLHQHEDTGSLSVQPEASTSTASSSTITATTGSSPSENPPPKKPGPRKPKRTLAALPPTSLQRAKKLTTLDKSLMDWKAHTGDSALQDELEANRKTGGYLEKVEFLKRVDERKEEKLESLQSRKRRKI